MYCPACGAEYRANFTVCSDCQVDLVADPPGSSSEDTPELGDSFAMIWSGLDPGRHAEICETLARENIPAQTLREQDHIIYASTHPTFEVYVPSALLAQAKEALTHADSSDETWDAAANSGALEIPAEDDGQDGDTPGERGTERAGRTKLIGRAGRSSERAGRAGWNAEDATAEIWSGKDSDMANMIAVSLRENAIPCRTGPEETIATNAPQEQESETERIFVLPGDEARAKEIVREIVDAVPPE